MKRRSLVLKVPKDVCGSPGRFKRKRSTQSPHCDYLSKKEKSTNRQRVDPMVKLCDIFEEILNDLKTIKDCSYFVFPVNTKVISCFTRYSCIWCTFVIQCTDDVLFSYLISTMSNLNLFNALSKL